MWRRWFLPCLPASSSSPLRSRPSRRIRPACSSRRAGPTCPPSSDRAWCVNPIDAFVLARLEAAGLAPSPPADKLRLLRRVTFDLTGLPPTLDEQDAFLADDVARRLREGGGPPAGQSRTTASAGDRTGSTWCATPRPTASRPTICGPTLTATAITSSAAFNADLPYDRFVRQQLAGDELEPDNAEAIIATGFLRLWPDEYNAANLEQRRQEILDDVTDTTGLVFLGMTFGCARCHDHKYDPIPQSDYYRLQAFFAPMRPRDDMPALDGAAGEEYQRRLAAWEEATKDIRDRDGRAGRRQARASCGRTPWRSSAPRSSEAVLTPGRSARRIRS